MALDRTETRVKLQAPNGSYYPVTLADKGDGVIVPEGDAESGGSSSGDAYVALLGDDAQVYRWSLNDPEESVVTHRIALSVDQAESAVAGLDLRLGSAWLRVTVELKPDGDGNSVPVLVTVAGTPWSEAAGGGAAMTRAEFVENGLGTEFERDLVGAEFSGNKVECEFA